MLLGYQRMDPADMFVAYPVELETSVEAIISQPGLRVPCDRCGEEIMNGRELRHAGLTLCRACAGNAYYRRLDGSSPTAEPCLDL
jgi:formylmethanofuran dehydrogenase subunit E